MSVRGWRAAEIVPQRRDDASASVRKRPTALMSLIQSAQLNGHEPFSYLKDVLERLPTQPYSRIEELLPHRWQPSDCA